MGMFDTVWVNCPYCKERIGLQSKAGECLLNYYTLQNAPLSILVDLEENNRYHGCDSCGKPIKIVADVKPVFNVEKEEE